MGKRKLDSFATMRFGQSHGTEVRPSGLAGLAGFADRFGIDIDDIDGPLKWLLSASPFSHTGVAPACRASSGSRRLPLGSIKSGNAGGAQLAHVNARSERSHASDRG